MDQEVIREGMRDVFGSFEDFHRNLSNVSNLTSIFGVVPNLPPPRHHMVNNGYHHGRNVASPQPNAKECIQRMTSDLIPNAPLLPLDKSLPAFNKSFLSGPPSSSSRSTPEQNDQKRTAIKRKTKTDSDSEVERGRDRRKKTKEALPIDNKPGTSQGSKPSGARGDDQMRELFGDDEKDCLKAISPDSGVHSTENELLDDTQSILNMFTKVSSPLSPLPLDKGLTAKAVKDRMGKENKEKREKEEAESRRIAQEQKEKDRERERERARKEQEEKDRRRKENERRERKEAERREAERKADEAKKAAEQRRLEEEAEAQKAAEARRVAEEEEKARLAAEEEERSRKAAETERRRLAAEEERKKAEEAAEDERRKLKDMERKKKEERKRKEDEEARLKEKKRDKERAATATPDLSSQFGLERLKGELSLKTLSPNKMKQLEDMGRTNGRIMSVKQEKVDVLQKTVPSTKELHNNPSKDSTSRSKQDKGEKKKSEKDRDRGSEKADKDRKKDKKSKVAVIKAEGTSASLDSSPRPSSAAAQTPPSTSNGREFRCACHECTPTKRVYFEMPTDGNNATHYIELAKSKKRSADQEPDQLLKMIMYIESAVYFALSSLSSPDQYNLIKDLCEMIKFATNRFISKDLLTPLMQHLAHRTRSLSLRVQASLAYTMYQSKVNYVWKYHHNVDAYKDYRPVRLPAGDKPNDDDVSGAAAVQQSPASSVHSSSNSGASRMVSIPEDLFINQKQELKLAAHLMYAHRLWGDSVVISGRSETDMNFFNCLESVCGHLCVNTPVKKMAIFVITGITWLRKEYELEKQRPQPPGESKRLSSGSSNSQHS